jgi:flagellar protein FliO/FliZ
MATRLAILTIELVLLGAYPAALSAQGVAEDKREAEATTAGQHSLRSPASPSFTDSAPLPLRPRETNGHTEGNKRADGLPSLTTVAGSLALVLGIFFLVVWLLRHTAPNGPGTLPAEVFEVLGRAPLANRQHVHLLRCGNRLLLVSVGSVGTGSGAKTLAEVTDPEEVERLAGLCRPVRPGRPAASLRQMFRQVEDGNA